MNAMQPPQNIEEIKAGLETTEKGGVRQSIRNCLTVFQRDPLLSGAIAYNILTDRKDIIDVYKRQLHTLTLTGELWTYLADLNEQAQERLDTIMEQMKATEGVTEELKRTSQMEWVQRCNNIHNRAEEIVLHEMIYS